MILASVGGDTPAEVKTKLVQAREVFQELEYPAWEEKTRKLLGQEEFVGQRGPLWHKRKNLTISELLKALEETGWNRRQAARLLDMTEGGVRWWIKHHSLDKRFSSAKE
jgi:transcriptional regulator with GAF, ATPase, and Fis domain